MGLASKSDVSPNTPRADEANVLEWQGYLGNA
jgi:hypothetical protein